MSLVQAPRHVPPEGGFSFDISHSPSSFYFIFAAQYFQSFQTASAERRGVVHTCTSHLGICNKAHASRDLLVLTRKMHNSVPSARLQKSSLLSLFLLLYFLLFTPLLHSILVQVKQVRWTKKEKRTIILLPWRPFFLSFFPLYSICHLSVYHPSFITHKSSFLQHCQRHSFHHTITFASRIFFHSGDIQQSLCRSHISH